MKTAKDLELSLLVKEAHIQQLKLSVKELEAEIERLKEDISNYVKITLHDRKEIDRLNNNIDKAIKFIQDNYSNPDGYIWHEDIRLIMNILEGDSDGKN